MKKLSVFLASLLLAGITLVQAQTVRITGTVTSSEDGMPMPGVSVFVKGTTVGVITDAKGKYELSVPTSAQSLTFSFVGFKTQEVAIAGRSVIDVVMETESVQMEEVVVTALGITRERKALGYNVQEVNSETIQKSGTGDVVKALSAKTSGVQIINSSGSAGAASYITIRGASSITGNNQPLFIVDGQPISSGGSGDTGNSVDGVQRSSRAIDINPDDIESITVLKGGAATALYGVQAANGVILINTKKGKKGQTFKVDINSSVQLSEVSQLPELQNTFAQGSNGVWSSGASTSWGPRLDQSAYSKDPSVWTWPDYDVYGAIVPKSSPLADPTLGPVVPYDRYEFFQTGVTYDNNASISGSNEYSQFYFSVGNRNETSVVPNEEFKRTSIRANFTSNLLKNLKLSANSNYVNSEGTFIQKGSNVSGVMLGLLRTPPSFFNNMGYELPGGIQRNYRHGGGYDNPYWTINKNPYTENINRFIGNSSLEFKALDWLTFKYQIGVDWYVRRYKQIFAINSRAVPNGSVSEGSSFSSIINSDLLALINHNFTENINLTGTFGFNMYGDYGKSVSAATNAPLDIPGFYHVSNTSNQSAGVGEAEFRSSAFFGDVSLAFYNMLYLGATGRYEKATSMPNAKAKFYPSANVGFIFSELPGLKDNNILSFGKLRASYALTANVAPIYALSTQWFSGGVGDGWTTGGSFPMLGATGFSYGDTGGSPNLTHESMKSLEVGTELRFLNNRVGLDFSYFNNVNEDLILNVPIAPSTGLYGQFMNAAKMTTNGVELSLNATPVKTSSFQWDINANFTKMKTMVDRLAPGIEDVFLAGFTDPQIRAVAGQVYRSFYGYDWYRDANGNVLINTDPNKGPVGYPMTNQEQGMIPLGQVDPDYTVNVYNTFSYKGISLSVLIDIKKGGMMWNGTKSALNFFGVSKATENREVVYNPDGSINFDQTPAENIVVFDGVLGYVDDNGNVVTDGSTNNIPVVLDQKWFQGNGSNFGGAPNSSELEKTDWFRIREITLSYRFNEKLLKSTPIKSLEVYFTGNNLLLITPYTGIDPETNLTGASNGQGMDYFNMPGKKLYTFGLRLGF
ncbi:SusC/RagA family TonB-linked outer membrane protein [Tenuifilum thalassicum]|uniref:SusC/RagA family TonB-linked outer membrane protein n=1 Tax=Tenuifilum thalassicum TaxID=2590900 RepID=A0A7D4BE63_9BACT|nr:SusC/RagA family TonB-linked outer membrane protein [Tenuifilum thalassicum]QKG80403.1 SusC/RagA family TonB-linked outer membrane protein [Tenuifilum thalassicum]